MKKVPLGVVTPKEASWIQFSHDAIGNRLLLGHPPIVAHGVLDAMRALDEVTHLVRL